ncbi:Hypothetical_protein [Hexamita inflata]|uniref:Hypothetical_protein n=1 Tax=Hexamita inflata TaxID=28002 RepID=A0AA86TPP1_9EUKA|nr:Hypothetical protein HINF_LOCUS11671 [Hexamita inflata]
MSCAFNSFMKLSAFSLRTFSARLETSTSFTKTEKLHVRNGSKNGLFYYNAIVLFNSLSCQLDMNKRERCSAGNYMQLNDWEWKMAQQVQKPSAVYEPGCKGSKWKRSESGSACCYIMGVIGQKMSTGLDKSGLKVCLSESLTDKCWQNAEAYKSEGYVASQSIGVVILQQNNTFAALFMIMSLYTLIQA